MALERGFFWDGAVFQQVYSVEVLFLRPLAVENDGLLAECAVHNGHFKVRSSADNDGIEVNSAKGHQSGAVAPQSGWRAVDDARLLAGPPLSEVGSLRCRQGGPIVGRLLGFLPSMAATQRVPLACAAAACDARDRGGRGGRGASAFGCG